jgi:hypothetical protein
MNENAMFENLPVPSLRFLYASTVTIAEPLVVGHTANGLRRIINITGGSFSGPRLSGKVLPGGADWQVIKTDGITEVEAKYTLETDDGALIYITNWGLRHGPKAVMDKLMAGEYVDPKEYYFRTVPRFETGTEKYAWLNGIIAVATGERQADKVMINVYEVI